MKGVLIWMMLNRGCYFWMKALFQVISFSFLIITVLILTHFESSYWHLPLWCLILKHMLDLIAYNMDLIGFARRNLSSLKYKSIFDIASLAAGVLVCIYFVRSMLTSVEDAEQETN